jgi:hypothetical protein
MLHIKRVGITFQISSLGYLLLWDISSLYFLAMKKFLGVVRHNPQDSKKIKDQLPESQSILAMDEKVISHFLVLFTQTTLIS